MRFVLPCVSVTALALTTLAGCGGSSAQPAPATQQPNYNLGAPTTGGTVPQQGYPQQQYPQQAGYPQQPTGYPQQTATTTTTTTQQTGATPAAGGIPGMPATMPTGFGLPASAPSGPSAQAIDPNFAGAATAALNLIAASEAVGASKEGSPLAGNFAEGQTLEQQFTFQPGKCYTIAAAGVGVQEIELTILPQAQIPGLPSVGTMGSAKGSGAKTVLGGGSSCIKLALIPVAVPAKWVLKASKGGGLIAGQLYSK